jgi:regulator of replication initiation timing
MNAESSFADLGKKVELLLNTIVALKQENERLSEENRQCILEKGAFMNSESSFASLGSKIELLLDAYSVMKKENARLCEENKRFLEERNSLKVRIDQILGQLEGT